MKILFLNRNFSGILRDLAKNIEKDNEVFFVSSTKENCTDIKTYNYTFSEKEISGANYLKAYEEAIVHGQKTSIILENFKKEKIIPDYIIANSCGCAMYVKEIFPEIPLICIFDEYYNANEANSENEKLQITYNKAYFMPDLEQCNLGIVTTSEQKEQIPKCFWDKIVVLKKLSFQEIIECIKACGRDK